MQRICYIVRRNLLNRLADLPYCAADLLNRAADLLNETADLLNQSVK